MGLFEHQNVGSENQSDENLKRWKASGEPKRWVESHNYSWNHSDWLFLLNSLEKSEYWPMKPDEVGAVLEELKQSRRLESDKPMLVMITSEGRPLANENLINRILALPEIQRELKGRTYRVRTFGGDPTGWNPSKQEVMMHAFVTHLVHARDYKQPRCWCTFTDPVNGRKYQVMVCEP